MTGFSGPFADAQAAGVVGQIADRIDGRILLGGMDEEIQTAGDPLQREVGGRAGQDLGNGVSQIP
ncbi:MAG: hypothetical protein WBQ37_14670 [Candidatus Competibacter sp.]